MLDLQWPSGCDFGYRSGNPGSNPGSVMFFFFFASFNYFLYFSLMLEKHTAKRVWNLININVRLCLHDRRIQLLLALPNFPYLKWWNLFTFVIPTFSCLCDYVYIGIQALNVAVKFLEPYWILELYVYVSDSAICLINVAEARKASGIMEWSSFWFCSLND